VTTCHHWRKRKIVLRKRFQIFTWITRLVTRWPVLVIALWLAIPTALFLAFPPLGDAIRQHPVPLIPASASSTVTAQRMSDAFHESGEDNLLLVVLTDDRGLTPADEGTYRALVTALHADGRDVKMLQDFVSTPALRETVTSKDDKAWVLPVGLAGELNTPVGDDAYRRVTKIVQQVTGGSKLTVNMTGPAATVTDVNDVSDRDMQRIEIATGVLVLLILAVVYRSPLTMMLPLLTIGASLMTARGVVSGLSQVGLGVCNETVILMTAMMAGAGTDYAVFLISRYHERIRAGSDSDTAVAEALSAVGKVIAASGATVAVTFLCMSFARLGLLSTVGPALAITVAVGVLAAFTLLPAILVLAGRRGWVTPRRDLTTHLWHRLGEALVRRPATYLTASVAVLAVLATCGLFVKFDWDATQSMPNSVPSNRGYAVLGAHFPLNETIPEYLVISSPHDLRTSQALADLEQMAYRVSQIPGMGTVRGITRPEGHPPKEANVAFQAGEVGSRLRDAATRIQNSRADLDRLATGSQQLADSLAEVRGNVRAAAASAANIADIADDPRVRQATSMLNDIAHDGTLDELSRLADQLPQTPETAGIGSTVHGLRGELNSTLGDLASLHGTSARGQLAEMQSGADQLANGSAQLSDGVRNLVDSTNKIADGLQTASQLLLGLKHDTGGSTAMSGFFIPPSALRDTDLRQAAKIFISPDGHTVRYLFQTKLNPFGTQAMDQVKRVTTVARDAQPNTELADATISVTGFPALNNDLHDYYNHDLRFIMIVTLAVVFLILALLLRAIVAPLHLILSVVISYLSALGIGVIVFQFIGGHPLSWSVPGMAFIVLVAVGADYNMLLISRVRDESPHDVRAGVIKTVGTTGGVITSAGLIFAASMFGLLFGNISGMVQAGFIIGVGLLVDTFLVRTVTVPALAVLIGRANWWPTLWGSRAIPLDELDEFAVLTPTVAQATAFTTGGSPGSMRRAGTFPRVSEPGRWMRVHDWDEDVISAVMRESVVWSESDPLYRCHSGTASISRADSSW
jgi:RND superfamily putative drug exporter